ncbi:MAG: DUF624 domain-containing protein [Eubacteriales bacterium]
MPKLPKIFDYTRPGKGVKKEQAYIPGMGLKRFFIIYKDRFWRLITLNLLFIIANFPIVFAVIALTGYFNADSTAPANILYAPIYGAMTLSPSPALSALNGVYGLHVGISVMTTGTFICYALALLSVFTFGIANTGMTYILRGFIRMEPVDTWRDFWGAAKRNLKQAIPMGILDMLILILLVFDIVYLNYYSADMGMTVMLVISIFVAVMYFFMRFSIYMLLITFNLPIRKIMKNSFIFASLNLKNNILALVGIMALCLLNAGLFMITPGFGVLLPLLLLISNCSFMSTYSAYAAIKKHMIDPYEKEHPKPKSDTDDDDVIFEDRG